LGSAAPGGTPRACKSLGRLRPLAIPTDAIHINDKWIPDLDDVKFNGTKISQARIDPFLMGIGLGYRFGPR
jgi:hypothetical protein